MNDIDEDSLLGDEEEKENVPLARAAVPGRVKAMKKLVNATFKRAD